MKRQFWDKRNDGKWYCVGGGPAWDSWFKRLLAELGLLGG